jgi:riboflavin kinase/FMN adenylyltransferase
MSLLPHQSISNRLRIRNVQVEQELAAHPVYKDTLLTIGVFDGVHLGHRLLISELMAQARRKGFLAGIVTFRQHPEDLLAAGRKLPFITDIKTRTKFLKEVGVDFIVTLSFTRELADLAPRRFIELLRRHLRMRGLVVGADFALGKGRKGDIAMLRRLGKQMDFAVTVVPPLKINGEVVSSTALRRALSVGDINKVRELTGRPFSLHGKVVKGAGRGEALGFPTANLNVKFGQALPPDGVYIGLTHFDGETYESLTNIGNNPTFGDAERSIESFLVDYKGDLYGIEIQLDIIARLRDEKKFESAAGLKKQIAVDVAQGKKILKSMGLP